jgi:hypothetical protein
MAVGYELGIVLVGLELLFICGVAFLILIDLYFKRRGLDDDIENSSSRKGIDRKRPKTCITINMNEKRRTTKKETSTR